MPTGFRAFSLVELLVVITIIVVLLSLLAPAMDTAVYHAEMTECAANMRAVATSVGVYAADYRRWYPWRQYTDSRAMNLGGPNATGTSVDTRRRLIPYLSLNKNLVDPFCAPVDLTYEGSPQAGPYHTYSSYWLWFGWTIDSRYPGMKKLGDRLMWTDVDGMKYAFDTLMSDGQAIHTTNGGIQATHPDRDRRLGNTPAQNAVHTWGIGTHSLWAGGIRPRLVMDCNYMRTDGSATRLDGLVYDAETQRHDERLVAIPERVNDSEPAFRNYLPR